jgi:hypothetical protein
MLSLIVATPIFSYAHNFGELRGLVKKEGQLLLLLTAIRSDDHKLFLLEFYEPLQDLMLPSWDFRKISLPSWRPRFKNNYSVRISLWIFSYSTANDGTPLFARIIPTS